MNGQLIELPNCIMSKKTIVKSKVILRAKKNDCKKIYNRFFN